MEKEYEKINKMDYFTEIIVPIVLGIGFIFLSYKIETSDLNKENEKFRERISTYEQILKYEYNRTFESFEEYIVYRADKILKEN